MVWNAPKTWVAGRPVTAAELNAHIRDNFRELAAAGASAAGDIMYADSANSMGGRLAIGGTRRRLVSDGSAPVWRNQGTASTTTTYNTLTAGYSTLPDLSLTIELGTAALIYWQATMSNTGAGEITYLSYEFFGATENAAADGRAIWYESGSSGDAARFCGFDYRTSLNAGSHTFQLAFRGTAGGSGTATVEDPEIAVFSF